MVADVTVDQIEAPPPVPLFWVSGAYHTRYLRTATGDVYENGTWKQLDPGHLPVDGDTLVPDSVLAALGGLKDAQLLDLTPERLDESLLVYPTIVPAQYVPDVVIITPYFEKDSFAEGVVPSADYMVRVHAPAAFYPFSGTLRVSAPIGSYQLNTTIPQFAPGDIFDAVPARDATYLQLPENLPARVLELAEQFKGDESPYIRANRLHGFLREKYGYATLDPGRTVIERPAWHDPVDWFLFERRWGDSRSFSSAFAILARAAGIPARVVAGWAIDASEEPQVVNANQAHQWAEIALDGIGWVRFDPTRHDAFPPDDVEPPLPMLVEELESSEDPQEREEAAEALGELGEPEALPSLVEAATNDESLAVQLAAVSSIHRIGVDELIQLLLYHEDPLIREAAADGLRVAGSSKGVDALRQALASDVDERVRTAAVKALEKIGGEKAELGLLDAAVNDESPIVRETAVRALGGRGLGSAVDEIVTLLEEDDSGAVREAAAWALGELEQPESLRALLDSRSGDPVEAVRIASEEALHAWGLAALAHVLQESDDPEQRIVAAQLLGELGDDEAVPFLGRALNDADASVRDAALGALQTLGAYHWAGKRQRPVVQRGRLQFTHRRHDDTCRNRASRHSCFQGKGRPPHRLSSHLCWRGLRGRAMARPRGNRPCPRDLHRRLTPRRNTTQVFRRVRAHGQDHRLETHRDTAIPCWLRAHVKAPGQNRGQGNVLEGEGDFFPRRAHEQLLVDLEGRDALCRAT